MKKFFLFAAAALMALVGCEKQDQSSLNFADVKQNAKISGTLVYVADKAGAASVETPVAGQRVYFVVAANAYATGAAGNQIFEAITDAQGFYEIVVPTGMKSINGNLKTDLIVIGEGASRIFLQETSVAKTLLPGDAKVEKTIAPIDADLTACQGTAVLKGKVQYNAGVVEKGGQKEDGLVAAPAGVKVSILVKYDTSDPLKNRTFVASTIADGTYSINIPVQAAASGVKTEITLSQFEGKYTEEFNNNLLSKDAIYGLNAAITTKTLADASTTINDIVADRISVTEPTTKTTKFKVKGEIKLAAEELKYSTTKGKEDLVTNCVKGSEAYTSKAANEGAYQIKLVYKEGDPANEQSIIYDLNAGAKDCKIDEEVAIYDNWKFSDVKIYVIVKKFAVDNYVHYVKAAKYDSSNKWQSYPGTWNDGSKVNYYDSQKCPGLHELKSSAFQYDGFYDVNVGTLVTTFTMQSEFTTTQLWGVNNIVDGIKIDFDPEDQSHQIYGDGLTY